LGLAGVAKPLPPAAFRFFAVLYSILYINFLLHYQYSWAETGKFQVAWTPPVTMNLGQKIFAAIVLFL
jgi:hypothetical protein